MCLIITDLVVFGFLLGLLVDLLRLSDLDLKQSGSKAANINLAKSIPFTMSLSRREPHVSNCYMFIQLILICDRV